MIKFIIDVVNLLCEPSDDVEATASSNVGDDLLSLDGSSFDFLLILFNFFFLFPKEKDLESNLSGVKRGVGS